MISVWNSQVLAFWARHPLLADFSCFSSVTYVSYCVPEIARFGLFLFAHCPVNATSYQKLRELVAEQVDRAGAHLIDLVVRGERGTTVVEVYIDSETGITSEVCSAVSREVGQALDAARELEGAYRLDISSPGIDRPLKYPWQYRKHVGRRVQVKMQPGQEPAERTGKVLAVDETGILIQADARSDEIRIPFSAIQETNVKAPW
jgi:ribosome maturation factor RimP